MPRAAHRRSARSDAVTGRTTRRRLPHGGGQLDEDHHRLVVAQHATGPVDQREPLTAGVDHRAEIGTRPAHRVGDARLADGAVDRDHARRLREGVDAEHVDADLREQVGHDEAGRAVGEVEHQLDLTPGVGPQAERLDDVCGVELDRARREVDVADLARRDPAELLAVVHALDPALVALGEVDAALVEEPDDDRLRVVGVEAHGQAGPVAPHAHVVARHGDRRQLEVVDVDADRVAPDHEGALEHAGGAARVARGRDGRPLLEPRRPRLGQADGELGADVHVGDALARPRAPNRVRAPPDSHTMEAFTWAEASTTL